MQLGQKDQIQESEKRKDELALQSAWDFPLQLGIVKVPFQLFSTRNGISKLGGENSSKGEKQLNGRMGTKRRHTQ